MSLTDFELRFPPFVTFIAATEAECNAVVASVDEFMRANDRELPTDVIINRVLFD
jgi:hypothetical protein